MGNDILSEVKKLDAELPKNWQASDYLDNDKTGILGGDNLIIVGNNVGWTWERCKDFAKLRNSLPTLIARIEELEAEREKVRSIIYGEMGATGVYGKLMSLTGIIPSPPDRAQERGSE